MRIGAEKGLDLITLVEHRQRMDGALAAHGAALTHTFAVWNTLLAAFRSKGDVPMDQLGYHLEKYAAASNTANRHYRKLLSSRPTTMLLQLYAGFCSGVTSDSELSQFVKSQISSNSTGASSVGRSTSMGTSNKLVFPATMRSLLPRPNQDVAVIKRNYFVGTAVIASLSVILFSLLYWSHSTVLGGIDDARVAAELPALMAQVATTLPPMAGGVTTDPTRPGAANLDMALAATAAAKQQLLTLRAGSSQLMDDMADIVRSCSSLLFPGRVHIEAWNLWDAASATLFYFDKAVRLVQAGGAAALEPLVTPEYYFVAHNTLHELLPASEEFMDRTQDHILWAFTILVVGMSVVLGLSFLVSLFVLVYVTGQGMQRLAFVQQGVHEVVSVLDKSSVKHLRHRCRKAVQAYNKAVKQLRRNTPVHTAPATPSTPSIGSPAELDAVMGLTKKRSGAGPSPMFPRRRRGSASSGSGVRLPPLPNPPRPPPNAAPLSSLADLLPDSKAATQPKQAALAKLNKATKLGAQDKLSRVSPMAMVRTQSRHLMKNVASDPLLLATESILGLAPNMNECLESAGLVDADGLPLVAAPKKPVAKKLSRTASFFSSMKNVLRGGGTPASRAAGRRGSGLATRLPDDGSMDMSGLVGGEVESKAAVRPPYFTINSRTGSSVTPSHGLGHALSFGAAFPDQAVLLGSSKALRDSGFLDPPAKRERHDSVLSTMPLDLTLFDSSSSGDSSDSNDNGDDTGTGTDEDDYGAMNVSVGSDGETPPLHDEVDGVSGIPVGAGIGAHAETFAPLPTFVQDADGLSSGGTPTFSFGPTPTPTFTTPTHRSPITVGTPQASATPGTPSPLARRRSSMSRSSPSGGRRSSPSGGRRSSASGGRRSSRSGGRRSSHSGLRGSSSASRSASSTGGGTPKRRRRRSSASSIVQRLRQGWQASNVGSTMSVDADEFAPDHHVEVTSTLVRLPRRGLCFLCFCFFSLLLASLLCRLLLDVRVALVLSS